MLFNEKIPELLEEFKNGWNNQDIEKVLSLFEDDAVFETPGLAFSNVTLKPQTLTGKEEIEKFLVGAIKKLPLKSEFSDLEIRPGKAISFRVEYYEINVYSYFECVISNYGRFQEMRIVRLENHDSKTINSIYLLKNIIRYRLKRLFK